MRGSIARSSKKGAGVSSFSRLIICALGSLILVALVVFYATVFGRSTVGTSKGVPAVSIAIKGEAPAMMVADTASRQLAPAPLPLVPLPGARVDLGQKCGFGAADGDAWLDVISERECSPQIVPSWYAQVHGIEPFERAELKAWNLHVYPTDDWYERSKRATDRCQLQLHPGVAGGANGLEDEVVWVSGLFDLKRGEAGNDGFKRPITEYFQRFQNVLNRGFKMVIFIPKEFEAHLTIDKSRVHVIHMNREDLQTYFPYWERVTAIRTSKLWNEQAVLTGWLATAPQARLPDYNPLVMSKLMMLRDAARVNPWGARYHMWMDAGHFCVGMQNPTPAGTSFYRRHMSQGMFVTHWGYGTTTEVHGLTDKAMHAYMAQTEDPLEIVRGGIFGGQLPHIECVLKAYSLALHQTLSDGYMGTEECIWAIIYKRLPRLFSGFSNDFYGNHGDNCASFQASTEEEAAVKAGKQAAFASPLVAAHPGIDGGVHVGRTAAALLRAGGILAVKASQ